VSDERDGAGSADTGSDDNGVADPQAVVGARPQRPTGKRTRRGAVAVVDDDIDVDTEADSDAKAASKNGAKTKAKKAKRDADGPSRNPIAYVITYIKQVVAELRKVIWPNRKQMISYTTVVLIFLAFMVALIGGVDLGLTRLVTWVFG
jgi:preprotein translocase subunit SecE